MTFVSKISNNPANLQKNVHWHFLRDKALEILKRQAESEGGQILILPSVSSKEAGGLSSRTPVLPPNDKVTNTLPENQEKIEKPKDKKLPNNVKEIYVITLSNAESEQ